jgi:thymidine phosphorylase
MITKFGGFFAGQTKDIAPADKVIYSLRDATDIVDEVSLITSSILSKKLAEGLNGLIMGNLKFSFFYLIFTLFILNLICF